MGGPQGAGSYRVTRPYGESVEIGDAVVSEEGIVAGPLAVPGVFAVGQALALMGEAGTIVALEGGLATVEGLVEAMRRRWGRRGRGVPLGRVVYTRVHRVPLWRLALEN